MEHLIFLVFLMLLVALIIEALKFSLLGLGWAARQTALLVAGLVGLVF